MVSSDFGKLDVMRHLISGIDCAIAGEATAVAAAPTAETFKKSRRFIQASPWWGIPRFSGVFLPAAHALHRPNVFWRGFITEVGRRKRNKGMTPQIKRKSHI